MYVGIWNCFSECLMLWPHTYLTNDHRRLVSIRLHVYVNIHTHVYTCILCIHGCMKVCRHVKMIISVWKYVGMWKCSSASYFCIIFISRMTTGDLGVWIYIYMYTNVYMYICMLCIHSCMDVCRSVEMFSERRMLRPVHVAASCLSHQWPLATCAYKFIYVRIHTKFIYVCIHIHTCIYIYCLYICMYTYIYLYIYMHLYIYICCAYRDVCMYVGMWKKIRLPQ